MLWLWLATGCLIHPDVRDSALARFDTSDGIDSAAFGDCDHLLRGDFSNDPYDLGLFEPSELPIALCGVQDRAGAADWVKFSPSLAGVLTARLEWTGPAAFHVGAGDIDSNGPTAFVVGQSPLTLTVPLLPDRNSQMWVWHWGTWPAGTNDYSTANGDIPTAEDVEDLGPPTDFKVTLLSFNPAPRSDELLITEYYTLDAAGVFDGDGWFEVVNLTERELDLAGLSLDSTPVLPRSGGSKLGPGGYTTIGTAESASTRFVVDGVSMYRLPDLRLNWHGTIIDGVEMTGASSDQWPDVSPGQSVMLPLANFGASANDAPTSWCPHAMSAASVYRSPGAANSECAQGAR